MSLGNYSWASHFTFDLCGNLCIRIKAYFGNLDVVKNVFMWAYNSITHDVIQSFCQNKLGTYSLNLSEALQSSMRK